MPYLEVGLAEIVGDSVGTEERVEEGAVGLVLTNESNDGSDVDNNKIEGALVGGLEGDDVPVSVFPPIVELKVENGMFEVKEGFSGTVGAFVLTWAVEAWKQNTSELKKMTDFIFILFCRSDNNVHLGQCV